MTIDSKIDSKDVSQVAALVAKYNRSFDQDHIDDWVSTFASNGVFVPRDGTRVTGHDDLREWFLNQEHDTLHVTTDPTLEEEQDGKMHHRCTVLVFRRRDDGYVLASVGQYDDTVVRTSTGWLFSERVPATRPVHANT